MGSKYCRVGERRARSRTKCPSASVECHALPGHAFGRKFTPHDVLCGSCSPVTVRITRRASSGASGFQETTTTPNLRPEAGAETCMQRASTAAPSGLNTPARLCHAASAAAMCSPPAIGRRFPAMLRRHRSDAPARTPAGRGDAAACSCATRHGRCRTWRPPVHTPTRAATPEARPRERTCMYRHRCTPVFVRTMSTTMRTISASSARSGESRPACTRARSVHCTSGAGKGASEKRAPRGRQCASAQRARRQRHSAAPSFPPRRLCMAHNTVTVSSSTHASLIAPPVRKRTGECARFTTRAST